MKKLLSLFSVVMLMLTANAHASKASEADVQSYLAKSKIDRIVNEMPEQITMMSQQMLASSGMSAEQQAKVASVLVDAWDTKAMTATLTSHLQSNFSSSEMKAMLTWLDSDLAKKMKKAEGATSEPDFQQKMMTFAASLGTNPPSAEKMAAARDYVKAAQVGDNMMKLIEGIMGGLFTAMAPAGMSAKQQEAMAQQQWQMIAQQMGPMIEQQALVSTLYVYKDVSVAELSEYTKHYQSQIGQDEIAKTTDGVVALMNLWSKNVAAKLKG